MPAPLLRLRDVAEGQWGLFTLKQAAAEGVGFREVLRMLDTGLLERVAHGVYRIRGATEPDHVALRAAWLQLSPAEPAWQRLDRSEEAIVSHTSAAALYGVGDLRADVHEFTLPVRRQTRRRDVRIHRGRVPDSDRIVLHGLPTTRAGRMVSDLLGNNVDPDAVARMAAQVLDQVLDYPRVVAKNIAPFASRFGFRKDDGVALLNHLLTRAGYRDKDQLMAMASTA